MNTYISRSIYFSLNKKRPILTLKNIKATLPSYTVKYQNNDAETLNSLIKSLNNQNYSQALHELSSYSQAFRSQMHYFAFQYLLFLLTNSFDKISNGESLSFLGNKLSHFMEITPNVKKLIFILVIPITKNAESALVTLSITQNKSLTNIDSIQNIFTNSHSLIVYILTLSMLYIHKEEYSAQLIENIVNQLLREVCNNCTQCIFVKKIIKKISKTAKLIKCSNLRLAIRIKNNCLSAKKLMQECQITKLKTETDFSSFHKYMKIASNNKYQQLAQNNVNDSLRSISKFALINCSKLKLSNDTKTKICNTSTQDKSDEMLRVVKAKKINYSTITNVTFIKHSSSSLQESKIEKYYHRLQTYFKLLENAIEEFKTETEFMKSQIG